MVVEKLDWINLPKVGVSAGIGLIDIILENQNKEVAMGLKLEDVFRIATCTGAIVAEYLGYDKEGYFETAFYSTIPLLEKTIARFVMKEKEEEAEKKKVSLLAPEMEVRPLSDLEEEEEEEEESETMKEEVPKLEISAPEEPVEKFTITLPEVTGAVEIVGGTEKTTEETEGLKIELPKDVTSESEVTSKELSESENVEVITELPEESESEVETITLEEPKEMKEEAKELNKVIIY